METTVASGPRLTETHGPSSTSLSELVVPARSQPEDRAMPSEKVPARVASIIREPSKGQTSTEETQQPGAFTRIGGLISGALGLLSADPDKRASFGAGVANLGIDLIPFVGPLKKLADARALVHHNDPALQHEGRTLFVLGAAELLLDTVTVGGSAFIPDELLTYPRMIRDYQRRANQERDPRSMFPDPVSMVIRGLLSVPGASALVDALLGKSSQPAVQNAAIAA